MIFRVILRIKFGIQEYNALLKMMNLLPIFWLEIFLIKTLELNDITMATLLEKNRMIDLNAMQ